MDKIVTVSIINDYSVIVEGVARMLEHDTRIKVVELADVANLGEPVDVALYDSFASMSRASHLKHLCEDPRFSRVVVYSFRADPQIIAAALAIGADGYITKDTDARTLAETLVRVANGERVVQVRGVKPEPGESVPDLGRRALRFARENYYDVVLYDTGGRFQIDEELVGELKALREVTELQNVVLVLDAAIGQESVSVAKTFHDAVGLTGLILTKLDGDARGGAALSVVSVTGCPILRIGTGERAEDLEPFYPDRMASRILGMGDVVSLVEKVQETLDAGEAERMQEKLKSKQGLDLNDFLAQMRQLKKMGSMGKLLEMIPGAGAIAGGVRSRIENDSGGQMQKTEALILSMTPRERRHPDLIDASRRKRIARGSGRPVSDVNELLRSFRQARQMAKKMKQMQKRLPRGGLFG